MVHIVIAIVNIVEITIILTLSLIFPIPANTAKLNHNKVLQMMNNALRANKVPLNKNFIPNITKANSWANANMRIDKLRLNTEKYV
jgi:hypothetical protein